jgi:hypothetical protein
MKKTTAKKGNFFGSLQVFQPISIVPNAAISHREDTASRTKLSHECRQASRSPPALVAKLSSGIRSKRRRAMHTDLCVKDCRLHHGFGTVSGSTW